MRWAMFFSMMFIIFVVFTLAFYYFLPSRPVLFTSVPVNTNFSLGNSSFKSLQFYPNMRFPDLDISYRINEDCTLQKKNDMENAFSILSEKTILRFHSVSLREDISVGCNSSEKIENGLFIAGEGGPINITKNEDFYVIFNGKILLIKDSACATPNIALHELLHVLGFEHSPNSNNIMYSISKCDQTIGDDVVELINKLYSIPSNPDLSFEKTSAVLRGSYLDLNISIRNNGFKNSPPAFIKIYIDDKFVKQMDLVPLEVGYGRSLTLKGLWIKTRSPDKVEILIETNFEEIFKDNNKAVLDLKK